MRVFATALALASALPAGAASVPTLAPDSLEPGQAAVVHTVFQGGRVETFDAEILGVLRGGRAAGDMILARATSERVIRSGVAQGMSGSPVYVDGKLIGALSSGWPFSREPVFGITPIGEMLDVLAFEDRADGNTAVGPAGVQPGSSRPIEFRGLAWNGTGTEPDQYGDGSMPTPLSLPVAAGGLHAGARSMAAQWLEPLHLNVVPGGSAADGGPTAADVAPGSAVAVDLMTGDLQLSAIGTVTWRDGDRVLLFGHPFFQAGAVRMPLSTAEITTIIGSEFNSFKLGVRGREVGVVSQDRRAAVSGRLGPAPRLLPLTVRLVRDTGPEQSFRFASIEDRTLTPTLIAIAGFNSMLESGGTAPNQTTRWALTLYRPGAPPVVVEDVVSGEAPIAATATGAVAPLAFLFANPYERLALDSLDLRIEIESGRREAIVREAYLDRGSVAPGGRVNVTVVLDEWWGSERRLSVPLSVPQRLEPGRYMLRVGGADEIRRYEQQHLPSRFEVGSLEDGYRRVAQSRSSDAVYAALVGPGSELTLRGRDYPALPLSARNVLEAQGTGTQGRGSRVAWILEGKSDWNAPVSGEVVLSLEVESQSP